MSLPGDIAARLRLPIIVAPMLVASGPRLVRASRASGVLGTFPRSNARSIEQFTDALAASTPSAPTSQLATPLAVNYPAKWPVGGLDEELAICKSAGVEIIITSGGSPRAVTERAHEAGLLVYHSVSSIKHANAAIGVSVDGIIAVGVGGGGQSGALGLWTLIPKIRELFQGAVVAAGGITTGAGVRAAEVLGADLAMLGTRFLATAESRASHGHKQMVIETTADRVAMSSAITGIPSMWILDSLDQYGIDLSNFAPRASEEVAHRSTDSPRPWHDLWSAGQGVELIHDAPSVSTLVSRLATEYRAACAQSPWHHRARFSSIDRT